MKRLLRLAISCALIVGLTWAPPAMAAAEQSGQWHEHLHYAGITPLPGHEHDENPDLCLEFLDEESGYPGAYACDGNSDFFTTLSVLSAGAYFPRIFDQDRDISCDLLTDEDSGLPVFLAFNCHNRKNRWSDKNTHPVRRDSDQPNQPLVSITNASLVGFQVTANKDTPTANLELFINGTVENDDGGKASGVWNVMSPNIRGKQDMNDNALDILTMLGQPITFTTDVVYGNLYLGTFEYKYHPEL